MARERQKHFVGYHNHEKMAAERDDDEDTGEEPADRRWGFLTKKNTDPIVGGVIWWITGEGQPREYYLDGWFVVDGAESIDTERFVSRVYGREGEAFGEDAILLNDFDWFKGFRESQGNFGLGIQLIQPQHLDQIVAAVRAEGLPLPPGV
jgi:hypothetical protein